MVVHAKQALDTNKNMGKPDLASYMHKKSFCPTVGMLFKTTPSGNHSSINVQEPLHVWATFPSWNIWNNLSKETELNPYQKNEDPEKRSIHPMEKNPVRQIHFSQPKLKFPDTTHQQNSRNDSETKSTPLI